MVATTHSQVLSTPGGSFFDIGATTKCQFHSAPPSRTFCDLSATTRPGPLHTSCSLILWCWRDHTLPGPLNTSWSLILCYRCDHTLPGPLHTSWSLILWSRCDHHFLGTLNTTNLDQDLNDLWSIGLVCMDIPSIRTIHQSEAYICFYVQWAQGHWNRVITFIFWTKII